MKAIIRISLTILLLQISFFAFSSDDPQKETLKAPQNAVILSQSVDLSGIYYTLVDLDNKEMVIVYYYFVSSTEIQLRKVHRTGIRINLTQQSKFTVDNSSQAE